jgi:hypothetical protein
MLAIKLRYNEPWMENKDGNKNKIATKITKVLVLVLVLVSEYLPW